LSPGHDGCKGEGLKIHPCALCFGLTPAESAAGEDGIIPAELSDADARAKFGEF